MEIAATTQNRICRQKTRENRTRSLVRHSILRFYFVAWTTSLGLQSRVHTCYRCDRHIPFSYDISLAVGGHLKSTFPTKNNLYFSGILSPLYFPSTRLSCLPQPLTSLFALVGRRRIHRLRLLSLVHRERTLRNLRFTTLPFAA